MNPIIEKIAKVIYEHDQADWWVEDLEQYPWDGMEENSKEYYRRVARGVIEALGLTREVEMAWVNASAWTA